jgi:hypothetical protein
MAALELILPSRDAAPTDLPGVVRRLPHRQLEHGPFTRLLRVLREPQ